MNSFSLHLLDSSGGERIEGVTSFVGEDETGSFGLLAGHAHTLAVLRPGLARFRHGADDWSYLASPGALIHFRGDTLTYSTRRYFRGDDDAAIMQRLQQQMQAESELHLAIEHLRGMERDMLKRLWDMQRHKPGIAS